jgi:hypothetical protein
MYQSYVTAQEYTELGFQTIPATDLERYLVEASRNIDKLTFNRIVARGFENLTEFQQELIREVVCKQADFLFSNADALSSVLDSYTINSVSMHFGTGFNTKIVDGVPTLGTILSLLEQTGLCCRIAR